MDRALGIIPARGHSKGVASKNLLRLGGTTLLERAIRSARDATSLSRVVVSTDDPRIRDEATRCGVTVVTRPAELASDTAGMIPVLQHAVMAMEDFNEQVDLVVCLQPTSPFRTGQDIDECVALVTGDVDSAQTVVEASYHPRHMMMLAPYMPPNSVDFLNDDEVRGDHRRQDGERVYQPSGSVYVVTRRWLMDRHSLIGIEHRVLIRSWESSLKIDTAWDFRIAELALAREFQP